MRIVLYYIITYNNSYLFLWELKITHIHARFSNIFMKMHGRRCPTTHQCARALSLLAFGGRYGQLMGGSKHSFYSLNELTLIIFQEYNNI